MLEICRACPLRADTLCKANNQPIVFDDPDYHCPMRLWSNRGRDMRPRLMADGSIVFPGPRPPDQEGYIRDPNDPNRFFPNTSFFQKVFNFSKSVASRLVSETPPDILKERQLSCFGAGSIPSCEKLQMVGDKGYCGACGCTRTALSELSVKHKMPFLSCPLARKGFSNHVDAITVPKKDN